MTIHKNHQGDTNDEQIFTVRATKCEEDTAFAICVIASEEESSETTTISSTTTTSTSDSLSEELPKIVWSKVPCPSQNSGTKRSEGQNEAVENTDGKRRKRDRENANEQRRSSSEAPVENEHGNNQETSEENVGNERNDEGSDEESKKDYTLEGK